MGRGLRPRPTKGAAAASPPPPLWFHYVGMNSLMESKSGACFAISGLGFEVRFEGTWGETRLKILKVGNEHVRRYNHRNGKFQNFCPIPVGSDSGGHGSFRSLAGFGNLRSEFAFGMRSNLRSVCTFCVRSAFGFCVRLRSKLKNCVRCVRAGFGLKLLRSRSVPAFGVRSVRVSLCFALFVCVRTCVRNLRSDRLRSRSRSVVPLSATFFNILYPVTRFYKPLQSSSSF